MGAGDRVVAVDRFSDFPPEAKTRESLGSYVKPDLELYTAGPGTFIDDLIRRAGGSNVAGDAATKYPQVSSETVVLKDPQVIVIADESAGVTAETVRARPGWQEIAAVRTGRIVTIHPDLTNRPGPRLVDGLELLAKALHSDRFR